MGLHGWGTNRLPAHDSQRALSFRPKAAYRAGDYLWSCQIADYVLKANDTQKNRQLKANCLRQMGYRALSTNSRSWYLSQALELEGKTAILKSAPAFPDAVKANLADYVNFYRVRVNAERSANVDKVLGLQIDGKNNFALHIKRGVVYFASDTSASSRKPEIGDHPWDHIHLGAELGHVEVMQNVYRTQQDFNRFAELQMEIICLYKNIVFAV